MNKQFLIYQFKSRKYLIIFLGLVQILMGFWPFTNSSRYVHLPDCAEAGMVTTFVVLMGAILILTPFIFSFVLNKKSVDAYFTLPIDRRGLLIDNLAFLFIVIYGTWLIPNSLLMFVAGGDPFYSLLYPLGVAVVTLALILFYGMLFLLCNNVIDGLIIVLAYIVLPVIVLMAANFFQDAFIYGYDPINYEFIEYLSAPYCGAAAAYDLLMRFLDFGYGTDVSGFTYVAVVLWGGFSGFMLYRNFVNRPVEKAEQKSDSFFAYPFIIYAYLFLLIFSLQSGFTYDMQSDPLDSLMSLSFVYVILFVCFMVAQFVYRRKIFISFKMIAFFVATILVAFLFGEVAYLTRGFGLSEAYDKNPRYVSYRIYGFTDEIVSPKNAATLERIALANGVDEQDYYYIDWSFDFDRKNTAEYNTVRVVLEDLRQEAIDDYYAGDGRYAYSSLSVMTSEEEPNPYGYHQFYYYTVREPLSDETFNELLGMKYSELTIEGVQLDTAEVIKVTGE